MAAPIPRSDMPCGQPKLSSKPSAPVSSTKKTRDETFVTRDAQSRTVNRCEGIAWTGGCTDTNEFNYLVVKSMRSLGVCSLENQARV